MVRRAKDDNATAVMERTGNPDDIAAKIAAADADARRAEAVNDIAEFRAVVERIADGIEPDGRALASIGDLARKLRLPPDAVSQAVRAVQDHRRLQAELDRTKQRIKDVKAREDELAAEIKAAQATLLALNEELAEYHGLHHGYPFQAHAVAAVKSENPLLFADLEHVAGRLLVADSGMSTATLNSMVPQRMVLEGHTSRGTWGG